MESRDDLIRTLAGLRGQTPNPNLARLADEILKRGNQILAGRYEILEKLGEGGMGKVYKARDLKLDRVLALKGLGRTDPDDLDRFAREARMASAVHHPNVVEVYDIVSENDTHFITMRLVQGASLQDLIAQKGRPLRALIESLAQAAEGLDHAHRQGVIHRDIKPGNILVDATDRAYLSDFGLARRQEGGTRVTRTGMILGTPAYMSPEQAQAGDIDALSDVYGLGATLYEVLTGSTPFRGEQALEVLSAVVHNEPPPPTTLDPKIPKPLEIICLKALSKEKSRRYASAGEFAADLRRWINHEPILASPPSAIFLATRFVKRRPMLVTAAAALLLLGIAAIFLVRGTVESASDKVTIEKGEKYRKLQERLNPVAGIIKETRLLFYIPDVDVTSQLGRVRGALEELQALAAESEGLQDAEPWVVLGMGWYFVGETGRAEEALGRAEKIAPRDGRVHFFLGRIALERSCFETIRATGTGQSDGESSARHERMLKWVDRAADRFAKADVGGVDEIDRAIARAYQAFRRGWGPTDKLCDEGLAKYEGALGSEEFWNLKGLMTDAPQARVEIYTKALKRRPHYAWGSFQRGCARQETGDFSGATADLTATLRLTPKWPWPYVMRAACGRHLKDAAQAFKDYESAIALEPKMEIIYHNRGLLKFELKQDAAALVDFTEAIRLCPTYASAWGSRAAALEVLGRIDDAKADYDEALRLDPTLTVERHNRARLFQKLGKLAEAEADELECVRRTPDDADDRMQLGLIHRDQGRNAEAVQDFTESIRLDPKRADPWGERGNAHYRLGHFAEALQDYDQALKIDPACQAVYASRAVARYQTGNYDGALQDISEAIRLKPDSNALTTRGAIREALNDFKAAIDDYNEAIRLDPKLARAYTNRALVHFKLGRWDDLVADCSKALELDPGSLTARYTRAVGYFKLAKDAEAREDLKKVLADAPAAWSRRSDAEQLAKLLKMK